MRECFLCGKVESPYCRMERHHLFTSGNRKKADKLGLVVDLCHECHNEPPNGAHFNKHTMLRLKQYGQRKAMAEQGWTAEEFIREFGRNYLEVSE